ncbi:hypothetical protein [uncultured Methanobrevibacter sp.]|nr:hypothetical protein [uncultured Methanobrevibacter sp.]
MVMKQPKEVSMNYAGIIAAGLITLQSILNGKKFSMAREFLQKTF